MSYSIDREKYAKMYGPTLGDSVRLGNTNLFAHIEKDFAEYGDESIIGAGKNVRDGMMSTTGRSKDSSVDVLITNVIIIDPILGVVKGDIGIKEGKIIGIGCSGNPDIKDNVKMTIDSNTSVIPTEGLIATPGGIDVHVHFFTPEVAFQALCSGITTLVGSCAGPIFDCGINPYVMRRMFESFNNIPVNVGFWGSGSSTTESYLYKSLEFGAIGFKIHEDLGAYSEVIDCCLRVADKMDVSVQMHTDTINESGHVEDTIVAINGRTIHIVHIEGAGGGHAPDNLVLVGQRNVIPSSTTPTNPYTINSEKEHLDMIIICHNMNPKSEGDIAFAKSRIRGKTMEAEDVLHDLGAISMIGSDSQGMGRIGEVIVRTWQLADKMKNLTKKGDEKYNDNERILRYIAKYTINPAITYGISDYVGSLTPGKFADIVLWDQRFFGVKPELILKGGVIAFGAIGSSNASTPYCQPLVLQPIFGGYGDAIPSTCLNFSSRMAVEEGIEKKVRSKRAFVAVRNTRSLSKSDMVRNDYCPTIEVDPRTNEVSADGKPLFAPPSKKLPLSQLYFLG